MTSKESLPKLNAEALKAKPGEFFQDWLARIDKEFQRFAKEWNDWVEHQSK